MQRDEKSERNDRIYGGTWQGLLEQNVRQKVRKNYPLNKIQTETNSFYEYSI